MVAILRLEADSQLRGKPGRQLGVVCVVVHSVSSARPPRQKMPHPERQMLSDRPPVFSRRQPAPTPLSGHTRPTERQPATEGATKDAAALDCHNVSFRDSLQSSPSRDSMNHPPEHCTPPEAPVQADSPGATGNTSAEALGRLSFEHRHTLSRELLRRGRSLFPDCHPLASKRSASRELTKPGGRQSPRLNVNEIPNLPLPLPTCPIRSRWQRRLCADSHRFSRPSLTKLCSNYTHPLPHAKSGHSVSVARENTRDSARGTRQTTATCPEGTVPFLLSHRPRNVSVDGQHLDMDLQPDSSPISTDQLAAEVKGIYAGLVVVEAKCINVDAAHATNPKSPLGAETWQALVALHRTLLYEHHDFLMATQHPTATPALRGLAIKYSMPARMWKHGIHAFLEILRHRRPQSQDYMLAFIYLAYQMMALLFETVPSFTDTWIECLGDLARYRMAIEEEREAHATWGGVAARWYTMASDRHPAIGRLYHHLGILERPSMRKFCFYTKSLTCVTPFSNARDSLSTLCAPIVQDEQTIDSSRQSAEARIVTYHALVFAHRDMATTELVGQDSLQLLRDQPAKLRDFGAYFAATNVASLMQLGDTNSVLWQFYNAAIIQQAECAKPLSFQDDKKPVKFSDSAIDPFLQSTKAYFADSFNFVVRHYNATGSLMDCLSFVHVILVCLHSLHALGTRLGQGQSKIFKLPVDVGGLDFAALASFLNTLALQDAITARMLECARQGVFLASEQQDSTTPLSEDYVIRGHIWSQFYFASGWFDCQSEDDGRAIETASMMEARTARVLWLGLFLAFHTEHLGYDSQTQVFSALHSSQQTLFVTENTESARPAEADMASAAVETTSLFVATSPVGTGTSESSEDGFTIVKRPGDQSISRNSEIRPSNGPGNNQIKRDAVQGGSVVSGKSGTKGLGEFKEQNGIGILSS